MLKLSRDNKTNIHQNTAISAWYDDQYKVVLKYLIIICATYPRDSPSHGYHFGSYNTFIHIYDEILHGYKLIFYPHEWVL